MICAIRQNNSHVEMQPGIKIQNQRSVTAFWKVHVDNKNKPDTFQLPNVLYVDFDAIKQKLY